MKKIALALLILFAFTVNASADPCRACNTGLAYPYQMMTNYGLDYASLSAACHDVAGHPVGSGPMCRATLTASACTFGRPNPATEPYKCNLGTQTLYVPDRGPPSESCPDCDEDNDPDALGQFTSRWVTVFGCGAWGSTCG